MNSRHLLQFGLLTCITLASVPREARSETPASDPQITGKLTHLAPTLLQQAGTVPEGAAQPDVLVLSNEPIEQNAHLIAEFDLSTVTERSVPLARLTLAALAKMTLKRPGQSPSVERGAVHLFAPSAANKGPQLVASLPAKPGFATDYHFDVTDAVNEALTGKNGPPKLQLEIRLTGKPAFYEVLELPNGADKTSVQLQVVTESGWTDDWEERLTPIAHGPTVYRESALPLVEDRAAEATVQLLYPAKKIVTVTRLLTGETLREGNDWQLRDGKLVLKAGNPAIQLAAEFFAVPRVGKDGKTTYTRGSTQLKEGTWYQERQIEVTYEPASRDNWQMPPAYSSLADLPRTKKLLETKQPLKIILFGDSISAGGNASAFQGARPWQPSYGDLVIRKMRRQYESPITYMNHSRGGATSEYGRSQVDSQVAWFKPDLVIVAYGMNDRADRRRADYRRNLEKIIDITRAASPETEFIIVTPMLNNPKQPAGLDPVRTIRDEAMSLERPDLAFVDITSTHIKMLERKEYLDTSGNGANHPNDFLQRIYAQRVLEVLLP